MTRYIKTGGKIPVTDKTGVLSYYFSFSSSLSPKSGGVSSRRKLTKLLTAGCVLHSSGRWEAGCLRFSEESKAVTGNAAASFKIVVVRPRSHRMPGIWGVEGQALLPLCLDLTGPLEFSLRGIVWAEPRTDGRELRAWTGGKRRKGREKSRSLFLFLSSAYDGRMRGGSKTEGEDRVREDGREESQKGKDEKEPDQSPEDKSKRHRDAKTGNHILAYTGAGTHTDVHTDVQGEMCVCIHAHIH